MSVFARARQGDGQAIREQGDAVFACFELGDWLVSVRDQEPFVLHAGDYLLCLHSATRNLVDGLATLDQEMLLRDASREHRKEPIGGGCRRVRYWAAYMPVLIRSIAETVENSWITYFDQVEREGVPQPGRQSLWGHHHQWTSGPEVTVGMLRDTCQRLLDAMASLPEHVDDTLEGAFEVWLALASLLEAVCAVTAVCAPVHAAIRMDRTVELLEFEDDE